MIQPDGTGLRAIPNAFGAKPTWSSDGTKFAFLGGASIDEFNFLNGTVRTLVEITGFSIPIEIMPQLSPKVVSLRETGRIRVAIVPAPEFAPVHQLDQTSLKFGRTGREQSLDSCSVDGVNLVCQFKTALTGFQPGDAIGILRATKVIRTLEGQEFRTPLEGRGAVQIVP